MDAGLLPAAVSAAAAHPRPSRNRCHRRCLLQNATFGNVVELILSIAALQAGLYDVVSTSLLGSILSNLLLVLGMSFFVGGL